MDPLNKAQRRKLYIQFLLFYLLSLLIIIVAMYFYYMVPQKQIDLLAKKIENFKNTEDNIHKVMSYMHEADSLLNGMKDEKDILTISKVVAIQKEIKDLTVNGQSIDSLFLKISAGIESNSKKRQEYLIDSTALIDLNSKIKADSQNQPH